MSVQQDQLKMEKKETSDAHAEQPPKLELAHSHESLEAFGAALGGAVLGVLATLLILAIINNGTLRFDGANVGVLEAHLTRVDENVGAVQANVETLAAQLGTLQGDVETSLVDLDTVLADQDVRLNELDEVVVALERTRENFDIFTTALTNALSEINTGNEGALAPAAPFEAEPAESAAPVGVGTLPADSVQVYLFVDTNANGVLDTDEASLMGAAVVLTTPEGETLTGESTDSGVLFSDLEPGEYTVTVEDAMGFDLAGDASTSVSITEGASEGETVSFPVAAE